jgi:hypothetical protein
MKNYWKVFCEETEFPGLWPRWYKNQCAAVGWRPKRGQTLEGKTDDKGWAVARKAIKCIAPGDMIVVQLRNHRVGRIGEVVRKAIGDNEWNPTVPPSKEHPFGGKGRRIEVRWDLNVGPTDPETVVLLPTCSRLALVRPTICRIDPKAFDCVVKAMKDDANWVGLHGRFDRERSLSDYIATYPFRLEDNLMPYPDKKVRENAFDDNTRSDILLIDKNGTPVVVECKQGAPTMENIRQLRGYMNHIHGITRKKPRGILVHGGAASLRDEVRKEVALDPLLRIIRYSLLVDFVPCT